MGTKAAPGKYDCWENLLPNEPYFVLMARDPHAGQLVRDWAVRRNNAILNGEKPAEDREKVEEALSCADQMEAWHYTNITSKKQP